MICKSSEGKLIQAIALIFAIIMLVANLKNGHPTHKTNGDFTDHISQASAALLLLEAGTDIWKKPIQEICNIHDSPEVLEFIQKFNIASYDQKFVCQSKPHGQVLFINWAMFPRPYPLGSFLYVLPAALFFKINHNLIDLSTFLILQLYLLSTLFILILLKVYEPLFLKNSFVYSFFLIVGFLSQSSIGLFDPVFLFFVLLSFNWVQQNPTEKSLFFCLLFFLLAFCFHFRTLWYVGIPLAALLYVIKSKKLWLIKSMIQKYLKPLFLMFVISCFNLMTFLWILPFWKTFDPINLMMTNPSLALSLLAVPIGLFLMTNAFLNSWIMFLFFVPMMIFLFNTPEVRPWHCFTLVPFYFAPLKSEVENKLPVLFTTLMLLQGIEAVIFKGGYFNIFNLGTVLLQLVF